MAWVVLAYCAFAVSAFAQGRAQDVTPRGTVVVTRTQPDALLLWDASPVVADLIAAKTASPQSMATLESAAMRIAAQHASQLSHAGNVPVEVLYARTRYISPAFPNAVYAGTIRLLSITCSVAEAAQNGEHYADELGNGTVPSAVDIVVSGKLPDPLPAPSPS